MSNQPTTRRSGLTPRASNRGCLGLLRARPLGSVDWSLEAVRKRLQFPGVEVLQKLFLLLGLLLKGLLKCENQTCHEDQLSLKPGGVQFGTENGFGN